MSARTVVTAAAATAAVGLIGVGAALASPANPSSAADRGNAAAAPVTSTTFSMVRSTGAVASGCLPNAKATVSIKSSGPVEVMNVNVSGLPANTDFDLFVIQLPNAPFGISWYQGDLEAGATGSGHGQFIGRFSVETFAVAPGSGPAPRVYSSPIADATTNPAFAPVHTFHLGLWFNSPTDAAQAGCGNTVTPFNGEHNAGVQALSTRNFADLSGPLRRIHN